MTHVRDSLSHEAARAVPILAVPVQHVTNMHIYGPGMPRWGQQSMREFLLEKSVSQVGVVSVHCWNIGEPDGPYPIAPNERRLGEAADWVAVAHDIIAHRIKPVLEAAREVGIAIFHLAASSYADRYPTYRRIAADPELKPPAPVHDPVDGCLRPRTSEEVHQEILGAGFPGPVWETHPDLFDIAQAARPLPDENVITDGWQLNGLCRRMDIDTLFYLGFMANICLLEVPGALREMSRKFSYHCIVLRDCTASYEFPDTYEETWMTRAAVRVVEQELGYSTSSAQFIGACRQVRDPS